MVPENDPQAEIEAGDRPAWYAIRTKPHKEQIARVNYENQGLTVYLPLMRAIRRHARRSEEVLRPVFPGYLFLYLAPVQRNWTAIAATRGVIGPVCFGADYVPVPDWVILALREKEDQEGVLRPGAFTREKLTPGAWIEVDLESGFAAGGTFCSFRGEENVVVLLDILKRQVRATVPLASVRLP